ncbi:MAG: hypothetical protein JWP87_1896, partial [Labilithrix sp.]|nr:hypothetical protein [Labilithrix sp.]
MALACGADDLAHGRARRDDVADRADEVEHRGLGDDAPERTRP